jgi:uncharacterized membrane protein
MSQQFRLEVNGRPVRNPLLRSFVGVLATIVIAAVLLLLGVILLPIFIALLAIAGVAGYVYLRRIRRAIRQAKSGRETTNGVTLDPSMEVRTSPPSGSTRDLPPDQPLS